MGRSDSGVRAGGDRVVGTGYESHGLYHLRPSTHVGVVMESPSLIHAQLGHPSLAKLQQLVPQCRFGFKLSFSHIASRIKFGFFIHVS